jgi:hypothetical protein
MYQIHFLLLARNGAPVPRDQRQYLDIINIPFGMGTGPYPSVTVRMGLRGADVGGFVYHCHFLFHADFGMMATIRVLPNPVAGNLGKSGGSRRAIPSGVSLAPGEDANGRLSGASFRIIAAQNRALCGLSGEHLLTAADARLLPGLHEPVRPRLHARASERSAKRNQSLVVESNRRSSSEQKTSRGS